MKKILLIALISISIQSYAQRNTPCKGITREYKELEGKTTYMSAFPFSEYMVVFVKVFKDSEPTYHAYLTAISKTANYSAAGIYIKFEDGTVLKNELIDIDCSYAPAGYYRYSGYFPITDENKELFASKKMVKYQVSSLEVNVLDKYATTLLGYASCINNIVE